NHLAYFLLTNLLLDSLRAAAPSRIVNVSSGAHSGARLDFDDLQSERKYRAVGVYSRTKLANILFTYELARRLQGTGVTANCLHPGVVGTKLLADYMGVPVAGGALARTFGSSPEEGAATGIYLASAPELENVSGKYFEGRRERRSSRESYDEAAARRLWDVSERLTGLSTLPMILLRPSSCMPIYDYRCATCSHRFEQLVRGSQAVTCPQCSGRNLERLISLPARPSSGGRQPDYSRLGPPSGGGCCGGSCQSHSH
ncbi:MAG TPA: FmdB family zinc ribbon protein, partial [Gemmatimonadales bacterium]|nr:FmdB family zinc ribbon protein [Gemmatimonadales bacterium]